MRKWGSIEIDNLKNNNIKFWLFLKMEKYMEEMVLLDFRKLELIGGVEKFGGKDILW